MLIADTSPLRDSSLLQGFIPTFSEKIPKCGAEWESFLFQTAAPLEPGNHRRHLSGNRSGNRPRNGGLCIGDETARPSSSGLRLVSCRPPQHTPAPQPCPGSPPGRRRVTAPQCPSAGKALPPALPSPPGSSELPVMPPPPTNTNVTSWRSGPAGPPQQAPLCWGPVARSAPASETKPPACVAAPLDQGARSRRDLSQSSVPLGARHRV